jgi:hypothetical protein
MTSKQVIQVRYAGQHGPWSVPQKPFAWDDVPKIETTIR